MITETSTYDVKLTKEITIKTLAILFIYIILEYKYTYESNILISSGP